MKKLSVIFAALIVSSLAQAQTTTETTTTMTPPSSPFEDLHIVAGAHSWIDSGRVYELQNAGPKDRTVDSLTEYFFGFKTTSGWGVYGQAVEAQTAYNNSANSTFSPSDPSISITHPIYSSDTVKISGKFREYFQVSNWAIQNDVYQQAYYLELSAKLANRWDLFNVLIPRYFSQPSYHSYDTTIYAEDWTYIGRNLKPWLQLGVGQHAQIESHFVDPVGKDWDIFPYANFMLSHSVYAGPRVYFPLYAQNSVYLGDKGVGLSNVMFEVYLQAHL